MEKKVGDVKLIQWLFLLRRFDGLRYRCFRGMDRRWKMGVGKVKETDWVN
jgi:hypothetical protein